MTLVLGLSSGLHDASVALLDITGEIKFAIQEERLSRVKGDSSFPFHGLAEAISIAEKSNETIKAICYFEDPTKRLEAYLKQQAQDISIETLTDIAIKWCQEDKMNPLSIALRSLGNVSSPEFYYGNHHLSHACYAFMSSNYKSALALSIDAAGEGTSLAVYECNKGYVPKLITSAPIEFSLGFIYTYFTALLGFKPNEGEYKMMGMTPYGKPKYLSSILDLFSYNSAEPLSIKVPDYMYVKGKINLNAKEVLSSIGCKTLACLTESNNESFAYRADIAASIQTFTEIVVSDIIEQNKELIHKHQGNIVIAGGVSLNCVMIRKLYDKYKYNIHVPSSPGDSGSSVGACLSYLWAEETTNKERERIQSRRLIYSGTSINSSTLQIELECYCLEAGLKIKELNGSFNEITKKLSEYKIGAWVEGRSEFGPRALCSRSIICRHDSVQMKEKLNLHIKNREKFRPFAGVFTLNQAEKVFDLMYEQINGKKEVNAMHYTMNTIAVAKRIYNKKNSCVIHEDGSCRLQIVKPVQNQSIHKLLVKLEEDYGIMGLVNTSFNVNGQPNCEDLEDCLATFVVSGLDFLCIEGKYLVTR